MIDNFALIIGAMKCGTTSVFNYLAQHPEIAPCKYKEPHFFSRGADFARGFNYYQSLWNWQPEVHKIALEATPGYTKVTPENKVNAAANIARVQEDFGVRFKLIYIMRHPLKRIESHYLHDALKTPLASSSEVSSLERAIIDTSKYAMQLDEYYQRFPQQDILLLSFEEFTQNPQQNLRRICEFLEIAPDFKFQQTGVAHNSRDRLRLNLPGLTYLRKTGLLKALRSQVSEKQKAQFKQKFGQKREVSFHFSAQLKAELIQELQPDLAKLTTDYGFDAQDWQLKY